jgi:hypothetical protein
MTDTITKRPDPYSLVALLKECATQNGEARENAARLARYAAEYLGPLLDAADRAKGTLISAEFHMEHGSWEEMRGNAINNIDAALANPDSTRSIQ